MDIIESHLQKLDKIDEIDTIVTQRKQFNEFKFELKNISTSLKSNTSDLQNIDKKFNAAVVDIKRETINFKESIIETQMKIMKNNLIFYNIEEKKAEKFRDIVTAFVKR